MSIHGESVKIHLSLGLIISIVVSLATPLWPRWGYPWPYNWNIGPIGTEQRRGWFGHLKPMAQLSLASQIWFYLVFVVLLKFPLARVVFRTLVVMFWWPTSSMVQMNLRVLFFVRHYVHHNNTKLPTLFLWIFCIDLKLIKFLHFVQP